MPWSACSWRVDRPLLAALAGASLRRGQRDRFNPLPNYPMLAGRRGRRRAGGTMARKPQSDRSILEMFSKLGEDLKMPSVDVDAILAHHRRNLEALEKSARVTAEGASLVMHRQREMLQETLAEITDMRSEERRVGKGRT